jgi:hypothetical protein
MGIALHLLPRTREKGHLMIGNFKYVKHLATLVRLGERDGRLRNRSTNNGELRPWLGAAVWRVALGQNAPDRGC